MSEPGFNPPNPAGQAAPINQPSQQFPQYTEPQQNNEGNPWILRGALGGALLAIVGGVVAVLAFGVLDSDGSGANTPIAAAETLFEAADQQDPIGALQIILPSDYEAFVEPTNALVAELVRLEILSEDALDGDQASFGDGFKVEVTEEMAYESNPLFSDSDEVHEVFVVGGQLTITANFDALDDLVVESASESVSDSTETAILTFTPNGVVENTEGFESNMTDSAFRMIVVKQDGEYYIAPSYWIADEIRRAAGLELPNLANRLQPQGADSPEEALSELMTAFSQVDLDRAMSLMDPDEFGALHMYWDLVAEDFAQAEADVAEFKSQEGIDWTVEVQSRSEARDGRTVVIPNGITASITGPEFEASMVLNSEKFLIDVDGDIDGTSADILLDVDVDPSQESISGIAKGTVSEGLEVTTFDLAFSGNSTEQAAQVTGTISNGGETIDVNVNFSVRGSCFYVEGTVDTEVINERDCSFGSDLNDDDQQRLSDIFSDIQTPGFTAVERDGEWYISGVPSYMYIYVDVLRGLEAEDFDEIAEILGIEGLEDLATLGTDPNDFNGVFGDDLFVETEDDFTLVDPDFPETTVGFEDDDFEEFLRQLEEMEDLDGELVVPTTGF